MELTAAEGRVLGCLIEWAATEPDAYPVTLNSLRLSCNQAEGRQPIVAYSDRTVEDTLLALKSKGLARFAGPVPNDRSTRYGHRADLRWRMGPAELAVLAVLLLGGPQTLGAVQARADRLHPFDHPGEVEAVLDALAARTPVPFAVRLDSPASGPRARWAQVLAPPYDDLDVAVPDDFHPGPAGSPGAVVVAAHGLAPAPTYGELAARVAELERRLAAATERPQSAWGPAGEGRSPSRAAPTDGHGPRPTPTERGGTGAFAEPDGAYPGADGNGGPAAGDHDVHQRVMRLAFEPGGLLDRLSDIERRLARIEAELGAFHR